MVKDNSWELFEWIQLDIIYRPLQPNWDAHSTMIVSIGFRRSVSTWPLHIVLNMMRQIPMWSCVFTHYLQKTLCLYFSTVIIPYLYNNKCFVTGIWAPRGWIWACDSSLELSRPKNDQGMNFFWFARAVRPQRAKMCFLLHKEALNGRFEACIAIMNCR